MSLAKTTLAGLLLACCPLAAAGPGPLPGDLLLFPELTGTERFDLPKDSGLSEQYVNPGINLFYTFDAGRFRFLLEWLVDRNSQEIQRFQVGWRWRETTFWLGRYHTPIGYWNTRFHHGAYMMTTINRPGIATYETSGGSLPLHLTGLYAEGSHELGESDIYYILSAGVGPNLGAKRLDAFDILSPESGGQPGASLRLAWRPTSFGFDEYGVSASYTEIPGQAIGVDLIRQTTAVAFANWKLGDFAFLAEALYVDNNLEGGAPANRGHGVVNTYGQAEWRVHQDWTLYSRAEGTFNAKGDPYFGHFQYFVRDRYLGGVRYELPYHMALKLELSRNQIRDASFDEVQLQWSAVFP